MKKTILILSLIIPLNGCGDGIQTDQEKSLLQETCASWINNSLTVDNINILINISNNFDKLAKIDQIYFPVATAADELITMLKLLGSGELFGKDRDSFATNTDIIFSACNGQLKLKK